MGRNDRLSSGLGKLNEKGGGRKQGRGEEVAKDRVGRNDRLSQGGGGEAERRKVQTKTEAAGD